MVDVGWEGIPNWVSAGSAVLTLGAAGVAAWFAGRAAHWAKKQAVAAAQQERTQAKQLSLAREEVSRAKQEAEQERLQRQQEERRHAESRLDAVAPVVFAKARPHDIAVRFPDSASWEPLTSEREFNGNERPAFRTAATIVFANVSPQIARIAIVNPSSGETNIRSGTEIYLAPGESREVEWTRVIPGPALTSDEALGLPQNWLMDLEFWVRDVGMNVRDTYRFNADFRHFRRDGSRLIVAPAPELVWDENVAGSTGFRIYERLESAEG